MSFEPFNFNDSLLTAIEQAKFTRASKIQKLVIPEVLLGHDVIASAHSGSGKSASFVLPLIQLLLNNKALSHEENTSDNSELDNSDNDLEFNDGVINEETELENNEESDGSTSKPKNGPKVLILAPTRELANQISACIRRFTKDLNLRYGILVGGAPYPPQVRMLKKPVDFLVATPGRLLDHLKNNRVNFDKIEYLVIDEINRMIDMKMNSDLLEIYSYIPKSQTLENGDIKLRQTLLFSGSLEGDSLESISREFQHNPVRFELAKSKQSYRALQQSMYIADEGEHKFKLCQALIENTESQHIIISSTQINHLQQLAEFLLTNIAELSASSDQILVNKNGKQIYLLVDEQSLDDKLWNEIQDLKIIHLDLPDDILVFLQRLEPAIDQASSQELCLLVGKDEWSILHQIERYIGKTLSRKKIEGLEPLASEPSVSNQISSGKFTNQTKNRNPYSGRRQNNKARTQKNTSRNKNDGPQNTNTYQMNPAPLPFENMDSNDIYNDQLMGNTINTNPQNGNAQNNKAKNSNPKNNKPRNKQVRTNKSADAKNPAQPSKNNNNRNNKNRNNRQNKNPQQNSNPQLGGNNFNVELATDDRDLSWKQYISNISNGNAPSKTANKKYRKQHTSQNGGFDLNHSPMAISAKKVRDIAKNEEWASEKKEASKPNVQIRVKSPIKSKSNLENNDANSDNSKSYSDYDSERIGGKLGINK